MKTLPTARPAHVSWVALFLCLASLALPALRAVPALSAVPASAATATPAPVYQSPASLTDGKPAPKPVAAAWLVGNLDTGEILTEHNPELVASPASVQKLLTALALDEVLEDKGKKYTATAADVAADGTRVGLLRDNKYTIDQLFHAMLMGSANDAAHALGEAAGGQEKAVALINAKAAELGMQNTVAGTTSGLDAPGQGTTVRDLFILAKAFMKNDYLMKIANTTDYKFPGGHDHDKNKQKIPGFQIQNRTGIVGNVDGGLGLKNGYTEAARGSFLAVAERDGKQYAAVILKSENSTRTAAIDLLDWAFNQKHPAIADTVDLEPTPTPTVLAEPSPTPASPAPAAQKAGVAPGTPGWLPVLIAGGLVLAALCWWWLRRRKTRK